VTENSNAVLITSAQLFRIRLETR